MLKKNGAWAIIIHGFLFCLFGLLSLFVSSNSLYGPIFYLGVLFAATAMVYGVIIFTMRKQQAFWFLWLLVAIIDGCIGFYIMFKTEKATDIFTILIGSWAIVMSVSMFLAAIRMQTFKVLIIINGAVSLAFGLLILFNPFPAIMGLNTLIGLYTILLGISLFYFGVKLLLPKSQNLKEGIMQS